MSDGTSIPGNAAAAGIPLAMSGSTAVRADARFADGLMKDMLANGWGSPVISLKNAGSATACSPRASARQVMSQCSPIARPTFVPISESDG